MAHDSSARLRAGTSRLTESEAKETRRGNGSGKIRNQRTVDSGHKARNTSNNSTREPHVLDASLKRRARLLMTKGSIPRETRSLIRYALEIKDPYLAQVVRRVEDGEVTIDHLVIEQE